MSNFIPVNTPSVGKPELAYLRECIETGWISSEGAFVAQFEAAWASYCGRQYGVAVSSGTSALEAAVAALDLEPGDEVILPTFTIISCVLAILKAGATPVLVDADPVTWCMDIDQVEARLTPATRAIMAVHIYGHPVEMTRLCNLCERTGVTLIEDAAEAHGAEVNMNRAATPAAWRRCGSFGAMSAFSFYANKIVTTGEGGMVLTDDAGLRDRLRAHRDLYFGRPDRFRHEGIGANFRMTNLQAAVGLAQVERIDALVARKREIGARYTQALRDLPGLALPAEQPWAKNVYWMYGVVLDEATDFDARRFAAELKAEGIGSRPFFMGMHAQPVLRERGLFRDEAYPVAERLTRQGLYLPSGIALTDAELSRVCDTIQRIFQGWR